MLLPVLYHWSPRDRYHDIVTGGLKPFSEPTVSTVNDLNGTTVTGWPYICLGTSPSAAWSLSGDMDWTTEIEEWDLWQVRLSDDDEVHFRAEFGASLKEIRVHNAIGPDRVWWVATRSPQVAREKPQPRQTRRKKS